MLVYNHLFFLPWFLARRGYFLGKPRLFFLPGGRLGGVMRCPERAFSSPSCLASQGWVCSILELLHYSLHAMESVQWVGLVNWFKGPAATVSWAISAGWVGNYLALQELYLCYHRYHY